MNHPTFTPYVPRLKYPHMGERDASIWDRFVRANPVAFDMVAYDVKVGEGAPFDTTINADTGTSVEELYFKKIDVVASKGDVLFIIEVKPEAGLGALGQIVAYTSMYKRYHTPAQPLQAVILTDVLKPDMEYLAQEQKVKMLLA